eukprot:1159764-Pelagomonas_calceolata.AAC.9
MPADVSCLAAFSGMCNVFGSTCKQAQGVQPQTGPLSAKQASCWNGGPGWRAACRHGCMGTDLPKQQQEVCVQEDSVQQVHVARADGAVDAWTLSCCSSEYVCRSARVQQSCARVVQDSHEHGGSDFVALVQVKKYQDSTAMHPLARPLLTCKSGTFHKCMLPFWLALPLLSFFLSLPKILKGKNKYATYSCHKLHFQLMHISLPALKAIVRLVPRCLDMGKGHTSKLSAAHTCVLYPYFRVSGNKSLLPFLLTVLPRGGVPSSGAPVPGNRHRQQRHTFSPTVPGACSLFPDYNSLLNACPPTQHTHTQG